MAKVQKAEATYTHIHIHTHTHTHIGLAALAFAFASASSFFCIKPSDSQIVYLVSRIRDCISYVPADTTQAHYILG